MNFRTKLAAGVCAAALSVAATSAMSATTFQGNFTVTDFNSADPGLVVEVEPTTGPVGPYVLNVGQNSGWFDLFRIWTDETFVNLGEDTDPKTIDVYFDFSSPLTDGTVNGFTRGVFLSQTGILRWNDPVTFMFGPGDTGQFKLFLSDVNFNEGCLVFCGGLKDGERYGADVYGKIKYTIEPIPLPAAGWMLLAGLGGIAAVKRRRKAA